MPNPGTAACRLDRSARRPRRCRSVQASSDGSEAWSRSATPGRALTSVASSACASGRRRTTTMWSAPVAFASSSTIASTIASGETERDSPDRIRANDSASARRPRLERGDRAAMADTRRPRRPASERPPRSSRAAAPPSISRRSRRSGPRARRNVPAKIHQERRIRRSGVSPSRCAGGRVGSRHVG